MNIVSLFSGAGGLDLGFILAGHKIIWANDLYSDAVQTYRHNIGDHIVEKDIREVRSDEIPDCDMVIGGFPCQGFSVANVKRHTSDDRNVLYKELLRVIRDKQPKFFLAENVKGILSLDKGKVFQMIIDDFSSLNYNVQFKLLNAANYGVPQTRERVIIVGVRTDIDFVYTFPEPSHSKEATDGKEKWVSVREAIGNLPDPDMPNNILNHTYSKYKLVFNGYIGHRRIDPDKPAPTVTARGDDKGGVVILPHPNGQRRMTCREVASIQSFPTDFEFVGNNSSVYRQIGNAVPVRMAYKIANQFNEYIL
ncbi:MAG: DNA cytosine methyltransferase [Paludibacteraceae bacterium]|nr:DNA cytosine methyltransferase [Paludibacteraceae bacterium]MBQ2190347.1 DNA cytosine methyltransferase [Paludibacteraceae bacterium]MBQ2520836.1 DNA cytosine methyltransferase [Paludibacteraceae bacterium]MBQ5379424.1 DNA cytosine methyltransferase [Paludibacteraceae bacterium]